MAEHGGDYLGAKQLHTQAIERFLEMLRLDQGSGTASLLPLALLAGNRLGEEGLSAACECIVLWVGDMYLAHFICPVGVRACRRFEFASAGVRGRVWAGRARRRTPAKPGEGQAAAAHREGGHTPGGCGRGRDPGGVRVSRLFWFLPLLLFFTY